jgi:hypothetical protein
MGFGSFGSVQESCNRRAVGCSNCCTPLPGWCRRAHRFGPPVVLVDRPRRRSRHLLPSDRRPPSLRSHQCNGSAEPVTNQKYAQALARVLRRPAIAPFPAISPRLFLAERVRTSWLWPATGASGRLGHPPSCVPAHRPRILPASSTWSVLRVGHLRKGARSSGGLRVTFPRMSPPLVR